MNKRRTKYVLIEQKITQLTYNFHHQNETETILLMNKCVTKVSKMTKMEQKPKYVAILFAHY